MEITAAQVKALRDETGAGMMDCKKALQDANGDIDAARKLLRERGQASAGKKVGRTANEGIIESYLHTPDPNLPPKLGVMVELNCETDFVAKTEQFRGLARSIAMHIAAADPAYVTREESRPRSWTASGRSTPSRRKASLPTSSRRSSRASSRTTTSRSCSWTRSTSATPRRRCRGCWTR